MIALIRVGFLLFGFLGLGSLRLLFIRRKERTRERDLECLSIVKGKLKAILKICKVEVYAEGLENIPKDEAVLFVGNHRSDFDIVVGYRLLNNVTGFISKDNLAKIPTLKLWMEELHCLFLDRANLKQNLKVIIEAIQEIKRGISFWIYPEGTREKGESEEELLPFKEGSFKLAEKTGCKIIPVAMINTRKIMEEDFPRLKSTKVYVRFGEPILLSALSEEERKHIGKYAEEKVLSMIRDLKQKERDEATESFFAVLRRAWEEGRLTIKGRDDDVYV
mgnify:CR=1 FL=1